MPLKQGRTEDLSGSGRVRVVVTRLDEGAGRLGSGGLRWQVSEVRWSGSQYARILGLLGNHVCARGKVTPVDEQLAKLRAVTIDDVARVAKRVLAAEPAVCAVGPLTQRDLQG